VCTRWTRFLTLSTGWSSWQCFIAMPHVQSVSLNPEPDLDITPLGRQQLDGATSTQCRKWLAHLRPIYWLEPLICASILWPFLIAVSLSASAILRVLESSAPCLAIGRKEFPCTC
jgi:hypothetical protein